MRSTKRTLTAAGLVLAALFGGYWLGGLVVEAQDATAFTDLTLTDDLTVGDDATIGGDLTVTGTVSGGATTFNPGITLGTTVVTGTITSPFTATGGTDTFFAIAPSGAASATDIIAAIGDSGDSTEFTIFGDGAVTADGTVTGAAVTATGAVTGASAVVTGASGVALGAAAVTGVISSPFTATGGADVALSADVTADLAAADSAFRVRDNATTVLASVGGTGILDTAGGITCSGTTSLGWAVVDGTDNQSCETTCTSAAVFGIDLAGGATAPVIVGSTSAAADVCLCAGAS